MSVTLCVGTVDVTATAAAAAQYWCRLPGFVTPHDVTLDVTAAAA